MHIMHQAMQGSKQVLCALHGGAGTENQLLSIQFIRASTNCSVRSLSVTPIINMS